MFRGACEFGATVTLVSGPVAPKLLAGSMVLMRPRRMRPSAHTPSVGIETHIRGLASHQLSAWDDYSAATKPTASGSLHTLELLQTFSCFLCAWTHDHAITFPANEFGPFAITAFARVDWSVTGTGDFSSATPKFIGTPTTAAASPTVTGPLDADRAGCEVVGPNAELRKHDVIK